MTLDQLLALTMQEKPGTAATSPSRTRVRDLETILTIVRKINTSLVPSETLELVIDEAIRITRAERGFMMLADAEGQLQFVVGRNASGTSIHAESFEMSSSVLEDVFTTGESVCIENALTDERFEQRKSIVCLELQTIMCSALRTNEETIGVIYVDSKHIQPINKADVLYLFEILAGQAAIAIRNAGLYGDLKTAYHDLQQANEQIINLERLATKGEVVMEVSHELKNLVAIVMLSLDVLRRRATGLTSDHQELLDQALKGARRIEAFSQSLLTRTRAAGNLVSCNLNETVREFVDFMKFMPKFGRNQISLTPGDAVPRVRMDIDQIRQVLLNLVNNAVEAYSDATIEFTTVYDVTGQTVDLRVRDNGPGIDPSIREILLHQRITTKPDGHGYGLPICRQIMESHGGGIMIESEPGKGTTFVLRFPAGH